MSLGKTMDWTAFFDNPASEWISIAISLLTMIAYEIYLVFVGSAAPYRIAQRTHARMRATWVRKIIARSGTEVVVVQTLRNSLMAASFMASTSMLALIGMLTLSGLGDNAGRWNLASLTDLTTRLLEIKLVLLALVFFASFFFNTMAVRFYTHAGYMISIGVGTDDPWRRSVAIAYLNRAGFQYSIGVRAFFFCFPIMCSLFNTWLMMPTTLFLVFLLYQFDRIPFVKPDARADANPEGYRGLDPEQDSAEGPGA
jgi:uncharacterized membrane protein